MRRPLNGQLLTATEGELRELLALTDRFDDSHLISWLLDWAQGRVHYVADSPGYGSPDGPATAQRVISYLRQIAR